ncbi:MAG: cyclomaltodextrinase [Fervidobacterium sp.]
MSLIYPTPYWVYESVVYEIFPDRFAIGKGKGIKGKVALYKDGIIKEWNEIPVSTGDGKQNKVFYGGDLWGIAERLDYLKALGVNTIYLTPIFRSPSNHKYDVTDYFKVDPQFGGVSALKNLIKVLKKNNMKLILDGVFNHVGSNHPWFLKAKRGSKDYVSRFSMYEDGHRGWWGIRSLPELYLEENAVINHISEVLKYYLELGIDGFRLDCGQDLGPVNNARISSIVKSFSLEKYVVGELWTYPDRWDMVDGIMNYNLREITLSYLKNELSNPGSVLEEVFKKTKNIYGCWNMLDSHDTERIANTLPDKQLRKLAIVIQFTFPGVPVIFYGTEIGLTGGKDPECRRTMVWNEKSWDTELFEFYRKMINLRKTETALKVGNFETLMDNPLVFIRKSLNTLDSIVVAINPGKTKNIAVVIKDGRLLDRTSFVDLFTGEKFKLTSGVLKLQILERSFRILKPFNEVVRGYDQYKRIF